MSALMSSSAMADSLAFSATACSSTAFLAATDAFFALLAAVFATFFEEREEPEAIARPTITCVHIASPPYPPSAPPGGVCSCPWKDYLTQVYVPLPLSIPLPDDAL